MQDIPVVEHLGVCCTLQRLCDGESLCLGDLAFLYGVAHGVVDLVAEVALGDDLVQVEVDPAALSGVETERHAQCVGPALRDPRKELLLLQLGCFLDFFVGQICARQAFAQLLQARATDAVERVDYISFRF